MAELVEKLGLDWKLLLSQAVNFLILLVLLRKFVYVPILKLLKERRAKIEGGLAKAAEAEGRLAEANEIAKDKMKEAEGQAIVMMRATEEKSKKAEAAMLDEARKKEAAMLASAEAAAQAKEKEMMDRIKGEAAAMIKQAIVMTVELKPQEIDEAMVKKAVGEMSCPA